MKLYVFDGGVAPDCPRRTLYNAGTPDPKDIVSIPTMMCLIEHPDGLVLYDTGWPQPSRYPATFTVTAEQTVLERLKQLGVKPRDIRYVIVSHLHLDHAGYIEFFTDSEIIVSDAEFTGVMKDYGLGKLNSHAYIIPDIQEWIRIGLKWRLIGDEGKIVRIIDGINVLSLGPGHSYGMLALLLQLPKTGNILITSDAVYCKKNIGPPVNMPGVIYDREGYKKSLNRILEVAAEYNAQLWFGHDLEQFKSLTLSDKGFYD